MAHDHLTRYLEVESTYGKRPLIPMGHGAALLDNHAKILMEGGIKMVYCPMGFIVSHLPADYDNDYCAWCKEHFDVATTKQG